MKQKINLIVFDFDGVIVNSAKDIANAINHTMIHFGRDELAESEIISYIGNGAEVLVRLCLKNGDEKLVKEALAFYLEFYLNNCIKHTTLYKNVRETLEFFKDKKLGIVTNKKESLTVRILEGLDVRKYFTHIVGPESVSKLKPDPEGLLKVMGYFGVKPEATVMVGDSHTDIDAGRAAGTFTCGAAYGLGDVELLLKASPDFVVKDLLELEKYIE